MPTNQFEKQETLRLAVSIRAICVGSPSRHDVRSVAAYLLKLVARAAFKKPGVALIAERKGHVRYGEQVAMRCFLAQMWSAVERDRPDLAKMVGEVVKANAQKGLY